MNRDETKKILMNIQCSFANWKPASDLGFMIDVWSDDLADYSYEQVYTALKIYKATDTTGFAPSIGQLVDKIHSGKEEMNANEAWGLVYKALSNAGYHSEEEFDKLPPLVQKAIGSPGSLRSLSQSSDFNEEVEKSLFTRSYEAAKKRAKEDQKLPEAIRIAMSQGNLIGVANE